MQPATFFGAWNGVRLKKLKYCRVFWLINLKKSLYHKEKHVKRPVSTVVLSLLWNVEPEQPFRAGAEKKMPLQLKANI